MTFTLTIHGNAGRHEPGSPAEVQAARDLLASVKATATALGLNIGSVGATPVRWFPPEDRAPAYAPSADEGS